MTRQGAVLAGLFGLSALLRLHNAWNALPLSGFDGPYHAAYIGILYFEGRLPLPHESWSTYHPPLYYALCAGLWKLLPDALSPRAVLFALRLVNVASGLALGWIALRSARLLFPDRALAAPSAAALALFLPMWIGPSTTLGNELPAAALCALALWLLLRSLAEPTSLRRATDLGVVLGLALLTKLNAAPVVAAAGLALLGAAARARPRRAAAFRPALAAGLAVALVTGAWFARSWLVYGTPVLLEAEVSARVMASHGYGPRRPLAAYLSPDPSLLLDPGDRREEALRAVWPTTFASTWFDLHGSVLDVRAAWARRLAPVLFACGAVFTLLAAAGTAAWLRGRVRASVPGAGAALGLAAGLTLAGYVAFTWQVATFSTLKGSLLSPAALVFLLVAALGCDQLARRGRLAAGALGALLGVYALSVTALFWTGGPASPGGSPASLYLSVYSDAPTRRVFDVFERPRLLAPERRAPAR